MKTNLLWLVLFLIQLITINSIQLSKIKTSNLPLPKAWHPERTTNSTISSKALNSQNLPVMNKTIQNNNSSNTTMEIDLSIDINLNTEQTPKTYTIKIKQLRNIRDYLLLKAKYLKDKIRELISWNKNWTTENSDLYISLEHWEQMWHDEKEKYRINVDNKFDGEKESKQVLESTMDVLNSITEFNISQAYSSFVMENRNSNATDLPLLMKLDDVRNKTEIIRKYKEELNNYFIEDIQDCIKTFDIVNSTNSWIENKIKDKQDEGLKKDFYYQNYRELLKQIPLLSVLN